MSAGASLQEEELALGRGSTAVCLPVTATPELLYECVRSVLAHTPRDVPVLVVEEADGDPAVARVLTELDGELHHIRLPDSPGPVGLTNAALAAAGDADVVLLGSHAIVFDGWLERLQDAGRSDTTIGTASALGNNAGVLSIQGPYDRLPADANLERVAAHIAAHSPRARPRAPTAEGHCVWIARAALELIGPLDIGFDSQRAALIDFAQRCLKRGLVSVAADDVLVASMMPELSGHGGTLDVGADRALLERRHPYLRSALNEEVWPALSRSLSAARRALRKLSVTIDARIVRGSFSGAHAQTLELIETLDRLPDVCVRVLLDPAIGRDALAVLDRLPRVERLSAADVGPDTDRGDIVHRPYQVTSVDDLELLSQLGERLVINHLDLIAFHNPGYFNSFEAWQQHRRVTRQALAMADQAIFLSEHVAQDAIRENLVDPDRVRVMPMAVNREQGARTPRRPAGAPGGPFLLCIGNDFRHKNRLFGVRLLEELRRKGWEGHLVLAGARVEHGSSRGDEAAYLASRPELSAAVHDVASVDSEELAWFYSNAAAVVYATVHEGFGLIPFEAARAGTPCLFAPQASLAETLPTEAAVLVPWDASTSAERVLPLLTAGEERRRHIEVVTDAARDMPDWDSNGRELSQLYEQAARLPFREAASLAADAQAREAELATWIRLKDNMGEVVGADAPLPADVQRGLIAIAARRRLRKPVFALLGALYRLGFRARRR